MTSQSAAFPKLHTFSEKWSNLKKSLRSFIDRPDTQFRDQVNQSIIMITGCSLTVGRLMVSEMEDLMLLGSTI